MMKPAELKALQRQLHLLIKHRCGKFGLLAPALPLLVEPLPLEADRAWFPVPGMYGGFAYWHDPDSALPALRVESWSRIIEGSGQRHSVSTKGFVLLEDNIC